MQLYSWIRRFRKDNPRWVVLLIDLFIVFFCYILSNFIINSFKGRFDYGIMIRKSVLVLAVYGFSFYIIKTYRGIIRRSGLRDIQRIMLTVMMAGSILMVLTFLNRQFTSPSDYWAIYLRLSYGVTFMHAFLDRKRTRLNSSHVKISYAVFC